MDITISQQVEKFYTEIWNKKNVEEISNVLNPDLVFRGSLGLDIVGADKFKEYVLYIHSVFGQYHCSTEDLVVEKNKAFAKMLFGGIHQKEIFGFPASGKLVTWSAAAHFTFEGHKVSQLWVLGDIDGLKQQLITGA